MFSYIHIFIDIYIYIYNIYDINEKTIYIHLSCMYENIETMIYPLFNNILSEMSGMLHLVIISLSCS